LNSNIDQIKNVESSKIVTLSWFIWALTLCYGLTSVISFTYQNDSEIVSWVTRNKYPIQKELIWFFTFTIGIGLIIFIGQKIHQCVLNNLNSYVVLVYYSPLWLLFYPLIYLKPEKCLFYAMLSIGAQIIGIIFVCLIQKKLLSKNSHKQDIKSKSETKINNNHALKEEVQLKKKWLNLSTTILKWIILAITLPVFIYCERFNPNIHRWVDLFHEGEYLVPLIEFWHGRVPYKEIYLQHGLLHNLGIPWLGAKLFGFSLAGVRSMQAILDPMGWVSAYFFICCLTKFKYMPAIIFAILASMMHIDLQERAFFGLCSLSFLIIFFHTNFKRKGWFLLSGLSAGLGLLHSVEVGLYAIATTLLIVIVLFFNKIKSHLNIEYKSALYYISGLILSALPLLCYLLYHEGLNDFINNILTQIKYQLVVWGKPFPNVVNMINHFKDNDKISFIEWILSKHTTLIYAPILLSITGACLAHKASKREGFASVDFLSLLTLFISSIFFFRTNLGRSDSGHYHYNYMIFLLIMVYASYAFYSKFIVAVKNKNWFISLACFCLCLFTAYTPFYWIDKNKPKKYDERRLKNKQSKLFPTPSDKDIIPKWQWESFKDIKTAIADTTTKKDTVYDYSNQCALLFFINRLSTSSYFMPVYAPLKKHQETVIQDFQKEQPKFILFRSTRYFRHVDGFPTMNRTPHLLEYIRENYKRWRVVAGMEIWEKVN